MENNAPVAPVATVATTNTNVFSFVKRVDDFLLRCSKEHVVHSEQLIDVFRTTAASCDLAIPDMHSITVPEGIMKAVDFFFSYDGRDVDFDGWKADNGRFLGTNSSRVQVALKDVNESQKVGCLLLLDLGKRNDTFEWRLCGLDWLNVTDIGCFVTRMIDDDDVGYIITKDDETLVNWLSREADPDDEVVQDIMKYHLYHH